MNSAVCVKDSDVTLLRLTVRDLALALTTLPMGKTMGSRLGMREGGGLPRAHSCALQLEELLEEL